MFTSGLIFAVLSSWQAAAWTICPAAKEAGWREVDGNLFGPQGLGQKYFADTYAQQQFTRLIQRIRARGTEVIVAVVPPRSVVALAPGASESYPDWAAERAGYAATVEWFRTTGGRAPDLAQVGIDLRAKGKSMFRPEDGHWSPDGAFATAAAISEEVRTIRQFSWLGSSPQTLVEGLVGTPPTGALLDELAKICGTEAEPEWTRPEYTVARPSAPASALLDDVPLPPIVAVSSSFGHPMFFFPQALGAELDAEVLNITVASGKVASPLRAWLESPAYANPPDVMVWMFTSSHLFGPVSGSGASLRNAEGLRQLIPLADGGCTEESAKQALKVEAEGKLSHFPNGLSGEGHYLQFDGAGLPPTGFTVHIEYGDGTSESLKIEPDDRVRATQRRMLEFRQFPASTVAGIQVTVPAGKTLGTFTARVCGYRPLNR